MRKLAAELGVAHTAIYWHVGGRDELVDAVVDVVPRRSRRHHADGAHAASAHGVDRARDPPPGRASTARSSRSRWSSGRFPGMWFPAQVALAREVSAAGLKGAEAARGVSRRCSISPARS